MDYYSDDYLSGLYGGAMILFLVLMVFVLALLVVSLVAYWKLFKKAGKPGWASIVPFYSSWVLVEIAGLNWWWFLLLISTSIFSVIGVESLSSIASIATLLATFNCYYNISKKFNKDNTFAIFAGIFSGIFGLILGLSKKAVYNNNIQVSPNGVFGKNNSYNNYNGYNNNFNNNNNYNGYNNGFNNNVENNNIIVNNSDVNTDNVNNGSNFSGQIDDNQAFSFCGNCGTKLHSTTIFCPNCGTKKN